MICSFGHDYGKASEMDWALQFAPEKIEKEPMVQGDTAKAKAAYQDFLTLWKDADSELPVLIAAKAEYAKLP
jgi:hypothetical protein